jgi:hypothetical protein
LIKLYEIEAAAGKEWVKYKYELFIKKI